MSYDLTIRADREYSQSTPLAPLVDFLDQFPHVRSVGVGHFVLDHPPRYMNISLEIANAEGDSEAVKETDEHVNCIRLHIPYAHLTEEAEKHYFPMALDLAHFAGLQLYDAQSGEYITMPPPPDPERAAFAAEVMRVIEAETGPLQPEVPEKKKAKPKAAKKPSKKPAKTAKAAKKPVKIAKKPVAKASAAKKPAAKAAKVAKKAAPAKKKPVAKAKAVKKPAAKAGKPARRSKSK